MIPKNCALNFLDLNYRDSQASKVRNYVEREGVKALKIFRGLTISLDNALRGSNHVILQGMILDRLKGKVLVMILHKTKLKQQFVSKQDLKITVLSQV